MKVGQSQTFSRETIDVGSFDQRISMTGKFAVTLVVGHHDNDIGAFGGERRERGKQKEYNGERGGNPFHGDRLSEIKGTETSSAFMVAGRDASFREILVCESVSQNQQS